MVELRFREIDECQNCGSPKQQHLGKFDGNYFCFKLIGLQVIKTGTSFVPVRLLELEGLTTELKQIAEEIADAKAGLLHISHSDLKIDGELNGAERRLRVLAEQIRKGNENLTL